MNEGAPEKPRYIDFPCLEPGTLIDGKPALNRWSSLITRGKLCLSIHQPRVNHSTGHDFPGAQAMLYAAGVPNKHMMKTAPQVGYVPSVSFNYKRIGISISNKLQ